LKGLGAKELVMVIFATPDFGAGASIACVWLLTWAVVLVFVSAGVVWGAALIKSESLIVRRRGLILLLGSASAPLFCCLAPPCIVRIGYGNYPIYRRPDGKIKEGMSADEVVAVLGTPHERVKEKDGESWYYWIDSLGIDWFRVSFGPDGRVTETWSN
jgi:hypothetical protein